MTIREQIESVLCRLEEKCNQEELMIEICEMVESGEMTEECAIQTFFEMTTH